MSTLYNWSSRWLFSINHKEYWYFIFNFGGFSGVVGTTF